MSAKSRRRKKYVPNRVTVFVVVTLGFARITHGYTLRGSGIRHLDTTPVRFRRAPVKLQEKYKKTLRDARKHIKALKSMGYDAQAHRGEILWQKEVWI